MNDRVVAVDFDNTLCESRYPECGEPIQYVCDLIRKLKSDGNTIILWTCREGDSLRKAVDWCREYDVPIDYVNENPPERIALFGNDSRKIGADLYIDDRCFNPLTPTGIEILQTVTQKRTIITDKTP